MWFSHNPWEIFHANALTVGNNPSLSCIRDDDEEGFKYDVHFWIGKNSTQDEYGTAAYKTVELDTFHHDKPIQHREVREFSIFWAIELSNTNQG